MARLRPRARKVSGQLATNRRRTAMVLHINTTGFETTIYDEDGTMRRIEDTGERRIRISVETWPNVESARKSFFGRKLEWKLFKEVDFRGH
jgi:hypothetical protein